MIRLVVVDDDSDWRRILCMSLTVFPDLKVVAEGSDGEEAVSLCQEHKPDALLIDIEMPGKTGLEAAEQLKGPDAPYLVFITGRPEHALKAFELQAADYLVKPLNDERLETCVNKMRAHVGTAQKAERLEERVEELEHASNTDDLVGAYNRRYMDTRLRIEVDRARRHGRPLSCVMLDMDKFKSVNDTHGHAMGDLVLVQLCDIIRSTLRGEDALARYGGEEFLMLLTEADSSSACATAERLRALVEAARFGDEETTLKLTVSLGVATLLDGEEPSEMVKRGDKALYSAKETGRNKWVAAETMATA